MEILLIPTLMEVGDLINPIFSDLEEEASLNLQAYKALSIELALIKNMEAMLKKVL